GEPNADFFGPEQPPEFGLILQVRASRITKTISFAAVTGGKPLMHGERGRIGEAPVFANAAMQPLGAGLGGFDTERLQGMRFEVFAARFRLFGMLDDSFAGSHDEQRDVVAPAVLRIERVIAQAKPVGFGLPSKAEAFEWRCGAWGEQMKRVAFAFGLKELPDRSRFHERGGLALDIFDVVEQLQRFGVALRQ